ncbi:filamentous hemagglutinin family N-terminal domain protein [Rivularia sp. PCC 7116]|uniref:beta strand repeat-containing protein n=1 Tax=Rivularia sp. PCC 7116 TaxID=373994 RepID=UPI00029F123C|nr:filamentous hemagglutinin N-terminal domain-containing protein [Rivularia sp. PCC 7116]AFY55540.1 filamentous hemagglutinin family N-terminal domain protein [Rivularia sp. PCC 7116]
MPIKYSFYERLRFTLAGIAGCMGVFLITNSALAQQSNITPDNTLGRENSRLNRNVEIKGINADKIDGGARRNSNLFHSFSEFNINNGQAVYFANPDGVENILTRVTGGNQSNIFGTLGVDGAANLFLINPNGIVFGENASLDLKGSFVGTTASGLQFGEQGSFSATNPEIPGSLTVNPSALFFNQVEASGGIINKSQAAAGINPYGFETTGLRVPDGKSLLLVGGDINFDGGRLRAYEGNIELASVTSPGSIGLDISGDSFSLNIPEDVERGDVSLANQSFISVLGAGGGNFTINARNLELSNSSIYAGIAENSDNPNAQAGDINFNATGSIELKNNVLIDNRVYSQGNAGSININANSLFLGSDSAINNDNFGIGNAGNININARENIFLQGSGNLPSFDNSNDLEDTRLTAISSFVLSEAIGNAGNIQLTTGNLSVTDGASIYSDTAGKGNAGNITINARDTVSFDNISSISSSIFPEGVGEGGNIRVTTKNLALTNGSRISTAVLGKGNGGNILIEASDSVKLDGFVGNPNAVSSTENLSDRIVPVRILSDLLGFGVGKGGDIQITTNNLSVSNLAEISASTSGEGDAGNITINARDKVTFSDFGTASSTATNLFDFLPIPIDVGNGGDIRINTGELLLKNGGFISASNNGGKNAGNIFLDVRDTITVDGVASNGLESSANTFTSNGSAGNIEVKTGSLFLTNSGYISTALSTEETADEIPSAGDIKINARDTVKIDGESSLFTSLLSGTGESGNIEIETKSLSINNAMLSTITAGKGNAGNIKLTIESLSLDNSGFISTGTLDKGDAGNIQINATDLILLSNSSRISSDVGVGAEGKGGSIDINTQDLTLIDGSRITSGLEGKGRGGEININASESVNLSGIGSNGFFSGIFTSTAAGASGDAGNVTVTTGDFNLKDYAIVNARTFNDGNAGNITFNANTFEATNGGQVNTSTFNSGNAGDINLNIKDKIILSGNEQDFTGLFAATSSESTGKGGSVFIDSRSIIIDNNAVISVSTSGKGDAGEIELNADSFDLNNDARITANTLGKGDAGNIELNATDSILLSNSSVIESDVNSGAEGKGGSIDINTQTLKLIDGSGIASRVFGKGKGGEININASESVTLSGIDSDGFFSGIFTLTATEASGDAGNLTVTTGDFNLKDDAIVNAITSNDSKAGNITFNANTFAATNGGQVNTSTFSSGKAGNINLNIKDKITFSGIGKSLRSGLFASTSPESSGKGGSIFIDPRLVIIENGAGISVGSDGSGDAGDITLQAGTLQLNNGFITAQTASTEGGDITLQISDLLLLRNQSQITTTAGTAQAGGNGGNITIDSKFIVAPQNENSDITANAFSGNGGTVNINSRGIFGIESQESLTLKSDITASSEEAIAGETNINKDDTSSIQNSFTELSPNIDTDAIIANSCIARGNKRQENSFRNTGSGALPTNRAGNIFVSKYATGKVRTVESNNPAWKKGDAIVEPSGLYRLKNGELLLSRECTN